MCIIEGCQKPNESGKNFCKEHFIAEAEKVFLDNTNPKELGITKWLAYMYPEHFRDEFGESHLEIYLTLLRTYDPRYVNKMHRLRELIAPRGYSKTKIIFGIISYIAAHNGQKIRVLASDMTIFEIVLNEKFVVIYSETGQMAEDFVVNIRDEFTINERIRYFYRFSIQNAREEETGQWTKRAFKINGMFVLGLGAGQQARGKIRGAYRVTFACHKKGSLVWNNNELVKIEDTNWKKKSRNAECVDIKINGIPHKESVTLDHKYWVRNREVTRDKKGNYTYSFLEPGWKEASKLDLNSYIGTPIINNVVDIPKFKRWNNKGKTILKNKNGTIKQTKINPETEWIYETPNYYYSKDFWWMLGLWYGDGTASKHRLSFSCTKKYPKIINRLESFLRSIGKKPYRHEHSNHYDISYGDKYLAEYLKSFRKGNSIKMIPDWIIQGEIELVKEFIRGYVESDGWVDINNNQIRITSINYETLLVVSYMLARLNIPSSIRLGASPRIEKFEANSRKYNSLSKQKYDIMFNQNCEWLNLNIKSPKRINGKAIFIENGWMWRRVSFLGEGELSEIIQVDVPNGEAFLDMYKKEHSYLTPFGISHNCYDDIYSENNVKTPETREGIKKWFYNAAQKSIDDLLGKSFLVGTIVHEDTVLVECEKSKVWKTLKYLPMPILKFKEFINKHLKINFDANICELPFGDEEEFIAIKKQVDYFTEVQRSEDWGLTWASRISLYDLAIKYKESIENSSIAGFYQEYFHEIVPSELKKFSPSYFRKIPGDWSIIHEYGYTWFHCKDLYEEPQMINIEFGLDLSSGKDEGDNVCITVLGHTADGRFYVLEQKSGKFTMRDNVDHNDVRMDRIILDREFVKKIGYLDETFRLTLEYKPKIIKIGTGGGLESSIVDEMYRLFRMNQEYVVIIPRPQTNREGKKEVRITETLLSKYETMSVFHRLGLTQLEHQLEFLGKAKFDDDADSLEVAAFNINRPINIPYKMFNKTPQTRKSNWGYERPMVGDWLNTWKVN